MNKSLFALLAFLISSIANAYIPDYHMIMSRTAENHGRGVYVIEQDVVFRGDPDPLVVHETWWIAGENSLRVQLEGRGTLKGLVHGTIVYNSNQKTWLEEGSEGLKTSRLTDDWFEPFFHFRYSKNMKPRLVALKMAPPESLRERGVQLVNKETLEYKYPPQNFVRLARAGGTVSYAIGTPTPPEDSQSLPGLWIEQDQFVISKLRLPSQALVTATGYSRQTENLWLPQSRTLSWGAHSVQFHTASVKWLGSKAKPDLFLINPADGKKNSALYLKWPQQDTIREFYQRFR